MTHRILVGPRRGWLADAVEAGGAEVLDSGVGGGVDGPVDAVVWTDPKHPDGLRDVLDAHPDVEWVQLPWAGIEPFVPILDHDRVWTCGKGVYADPVAEQALLFALMGLRGMASYAGADTWLPPEGRNLLGASVVIAGAGGIAASLLRLLEPFGARVTVVRRSDEPVAGADRTVTLDQLDDVLPAADVVFLTLALTPETEGLIDERRLRLLPSHAWLVNVARGQHVVTDDLVRVLDDGGIGGAGLDVIDPEPLPDGHPLWSFPNCFISPHVGNTPEMAVPLLSARVTENVRRFLAGDELLGVVDVDAGY